MVTSHTPSGLHIEGNRIIVNHYEGFRNIEGFATNNIETYIRC